MNHSVKINSEDIITEDIRDILCQCNDFTLTVNAVNDAPVLLQPLEYFEIVEDTRAAAMVQSTVFFVVVHPIFKFL